MSGWEPSAELRLKRYMREGRAADARDAARVLVRETVARVYGTTTRSLMRTHSQPNCYDSLQRSRMHSGLCAACIEAGCMMDRDGVPCRVTGEVRQ